MKPYLLMLLIGAISALSDLLGRGRQSAAVVVETATHTASMLTATHRCSIDVGIGRVWAAR
jgi:hypothetical protein